jgi:hypothetical protein
VRHLNCSTKGEAFSLQLAYELICKFLSREFCV